MTHKDRRGIIKDLLTGVTVDAVTLVTFTKGAVRGNHYHKKTVQYDYLLEGDLIMATDTEKRKMKVGELVMHPRGVPHAYKALRASKMLTMTFGPRQGEGYESDTYRLDESLV